MNFKKTTTYVLILSFCIFGSFYETSFAADTTVSESSSGTNNNRGMPYGPYWIDTSSAALTWINSDTDISIATTSDGGVSWNSITLAAGNVTEGQAWFDQETPGDTGDILHIAWLDIDDNAAYYVTYDISSDTLGTIRTVASPTVGTGNSNRVAITKTVSGNIIYAWSTQTEIGAVKSADNFATAGSSIADVYEAGTQEDYATCAPAETDDDDAACVFWDRSSDYISIKMYDDSGNSWTETDIEGGIADSVIQRNHDLAVRHSDNAILLGYWSQPDNAAADLRVAEIQPDSISSPTIASSTKANVVTDQDESQQVTMFVNQQNDDVYAAYSKGGTWGSSSDIVYHKSTDDMATWGGEQAYSEGTADDLRALSSGKTVGNNGGFYQPTWVNTDLTSIHVNLVNDVAISAVAATTRIIRLLGGFRLKGVRLK